MHFITAEGAVKGKIGGLEVERLRWKLRIQYLRGEWDAILETPEPLSLPPMEQQPARESIKFFFKAIAVLLRPNGDLLQSRPVCFASYSDHQTPVTAYASNFFAANVASVLAGSFRLRF